METPHLIKTEPLLYAYVRRQIPVAEIGPTMMQGMTALRTALEAQGVGSTGPMFTHHFRKPLDFFDFEICFPVAAAITPTDDVQNGVWRAMSIARLLHRGSYAGLVADWGRLEHWLGEQGLTPGTDFWESYLVTPDKEPDQTKWETELSWPLLLN